MARTQATVTRIRPFRGTSNSSQSDRMRDWARSANFFALLVDYRDMDPRDLMANLRAQMFPTRNDEKLIEKALYGSQASWVSLVKRYEGLVYNYCLRMTFNVSDAMDLMQEVYLAVYRNLPAYRGDGKFKSWMMRIAANKAIDFLRARGRNPLHQAGDVDEQAFHSNDTPQDHYQLGRDNLQVLQLLAKLPDEQRLVVELKFFQHFTFAEISQQTGISVNTIKTRLYTALQKLKGQLEVQHAM